MQGFVVLLVALPFIRHGRISCNFANNKSIGDIQVTTWLIELFEKIENVGDYLYLKLLSTRYQLKLG